MTSPKHVARPPVHMIDTQADALSDLALRTEDRNPEVSALLLEEITRAKIHVAAKIPDDVVTMHARVEFVDESRGLPHIVELVWPGEADFAAGRLSVLTPTGAGLIGLREGGSILWPDREGRERRLTIVKVTQPDPMLGRPGL
ncbi:nucleoside diphosphate kinase regulator [Sphingobium sp. H39-3-25]|uniref:nucleoside diphosphate kinase regulator n=1 Tax=Sphingobium arseniciresistens TaxID=3030834 RepID=UPI0023B98DE2|nr:nucleoside diphosphate kinase regulator [Sphingobium arseniciresistens]